MTLRLLNNHFLNRQITLLTFNGYRIYSYNACRYAHICQRPAVHVQCYLPMTRILWGSFKDYLTIRHHNYINRLSPHVKIKEANKIPAVQSYYILKSPGNCTVQFEQKFNNKLMNKTVILRRITWNGCSSY
jgi:hypothetical protein